MNRTHITYNNTIKINVCIQNVCEVSHKKIKLKKIIEKCI